LSLGKSWRLNQEGFDRLLGLLDPDREAAGRKYEGIRERLIRFFHWRGSLRCEDDADESIDRVIRRIEKGEPIDRVEAYVHGVAKLVLLESLRRQEQEEQKSRLFVLSLRAAGPAAEDQRRAGCLDRCLAGLGSEERELIIEYYRGEQKERIETRRALADRLRIPLDLLRLRSHRIRLQLESCLEECLGVIAERKQRGREIAPLLL
jgi:DNA-directed RNA polymerase specialized sigma24 family protein